MREPMPLYVIAMVIALIAGAVITVQGRMNGILTIESGEPLGAASISFLTGLTLLLVMMISAPPIRRSLRDLVGEVRSKRFPVWHLAGGIFGATLVTAQSWSVPIIGVAAFTVAIVGGQTLSALVVDKVGLGPAGPQPINALRIVAAALAAGGVAVTSLVDSQTRATAWWPVLVCCLLGMGSSVQQAINGRVNTVTKNPISTSLLNFGLGSVVILAVVGVLSALGQFDMKWPSGAPWWAWLTGACGVVFIAGSAWSVKHIGVLVFGVVMLTSQIATAIVLDVIDPVARHFITSSTLTGLAITAVAGVMAVVAATRNRSRRSLSTSGH